MGDRVEGSVIAVHGGLVRVQTGDKTLVVASRRKLHWEGAQPAIPRLVVGDRVILEVEGEEGLVVSAQGRANSLVQRPAGGHLPEVIAANIDLALIVVAARQPRPRQSHIDRLLVSCHLAGVEPLVIVNKKDQGLGSVAGWLEVYRRLEVPAIAVSARTGWGMGQLHRLLTARTTLFCGATGVGKSAVLNAVYPGFRLKGGAIADTPGRPGASTVELMPLPYGGFVVDTAILRDFGLWQAVVEDLQLAFPDLAAHRDRCQLGDCNHSTEPGCAVRQAADEGTVDAGRYHSYCQILEEIADADPEV